MQWRSIPRGNGDLLLKNEPERRRTLQERTRKPILVCTKERLFQRGIILSPLICFFTDELPVDILGCKFRNRVVLMGQ